MHHIRQLQCVEALEATGHFGRAADRLGITQSALTQSIQKLEEFYDVKLFIRDRRQVTPTPFGEIIVQHARQALQSIATADREIELMRNLETGHLMVAVDPLLSGSILAPALSKMLAAHPQLRFSVMTGDWPSQKPALMERKIELYLGFQNAGADDPRIKQKMMSLPPPILACSPDHELAEATNVPLDILLSYPVVSPSPPDWFLNWAAEEGQGRSVEDVRAPYFLIADDLHLVKEIVKSGGAITAALPADLEKEIAEGVLAPIIPKDWPQETPISLSSLAGRALPPAAALLSKEITATATALQQKSNHHAN